MNGKAWWRCPRWGTMAATLFVVCLGDGVRDGVGDGVGDDVVDNVGDGVGDGVGHSVGDSVGDGSWRYSCPSMGVTVATEGLSVDSRLVRLSLGGSK